ncbi:MAG TPA: plastocyanin/azurin family copper-binding protein [Longimicrobiales bacterium]|nr:plastocyanin/azurin family copper-binding protein [Longimicrobiales bacterium]
MTRPRVVPATLAILAGVGCAATGPDAAPAPADAAPAAVVEMTQTIRFVPDTVRVLAGAIVEWRNVSTGIGHTVTLLPEAAADASHARHPAAASPFDSGNVPPGGSWRHRFDVSGTYVYYCTPHESVGMVGVVIVSG